MLFVSGLFALLLLFITLLIFVGYWLTKFVFGSSETIFSTLFFSLLAGTFLFVTTVALYFTSFKSILSYVLLILFFIWLQLRKAKPLELKKTSSDFTFKSCLGYLGPLISVLMLLVVWFGSQVVNTNFEIVLPANPENYLYSQFAKLLTETHIESTFTIGFLPGTYTGGLSPYHYFDLWLSAGISKAFQLSTLEAIHFFTLPLLNFINVLGLCTLFELSSKPKRFIPFIAGLFLHLSGINFLSIAQEFGKYHFDFLEPTLGLYGEKLSFAFTLFIVTVYFILRNKNLAAIYFLVLVPLFFPLLLPAFIIGLPLFAALLTKNKIMTTKEFIQYGFFLVCVGLGLILLYRNTPAANFSLESNSDFSGFNLASVKMTLVELIYRTWDKPLRTLLFYSPFLLLLVVKLKHIEFSQAHKFLLLLTGLLYASALASWGFMYKLPEARQIYTNALLLFHLVLVLLLYDWILLQKKGKLAFIASSALVVLLCTMASYNYKDYAETQLKYGYSKEYLNNLKSLRLSANDQFVVAYLKNKNEYLSSTELITGGISGAYLQLENKFYGLVCLSCFDITEDTSIGESSKKMLYSQNFYTFVKEQQKQNKFISIEQSQLDFLSLHKIRYLLVSKNYVIPDLLLTKLDKQWVDELSGEQFLVLKN
ncbi:MAG TPA: hypothetical protein PLN13_07165 [Bacteroidia bacterium]|nr:hypothetical protein [Bacteroidia bacterium]HRH08345.1 hypothetical protein [Bacteroidia bacterium]